MKFFLCSTLFILAITACGQTKEVCVTIDDLPVAGGDRSNISYQRSVTDDLMKALTVHHVPAIGFVNESKLYTNDTIDFSKVNLLERWLASGMDLGNHTYSHKDYNVVSFSEMAEDVVKGEPTAARLLKQHGRQLRYLRQPFLHRGNTKEKVDSLAAFLLQRGYIEAPVTIDNGDWIYAAAYYKAWTARDSVQMASIGASYIVYMERKVNYYEMQSVQLFGYVMKQVLLIHASRLNADWFDALARMFELNHYEFIPLSRALTDTAYGSADTFYRKGGISWIDRWALTAGKKGDYFKDEPRVPDVIMKMAGIESE
jgi:peptidoglycan/xylan/chitin deacetylase (PgdA/CDA1 family)